MEIREIIYNYPTKYKEGFLQSEVDRLLQEYPDINVENFNLALFGITAMIKEHEIVFNRYDIEKAFRYGIENRNLKMFDI